MEHSSHGCSERVVVRVEQRRVVGAAPWSEGLGGSEQRFNGLVSENYQGGYRLEACRPGLIATCRADALHDLLAAELLQVVGRAGGTILCECLRKIIFDNIYAVMPSSWNTPRMAARS